MYYNLQLPEKAQRWMDQTAEKELDGVLHTSELLESPYKLDQKSKSQHFTVDPRKKEKP